VRVEPEPERPKADIVLKQEKKAPPKVEPPAPDLRKIEAEKRRAEAEKKRLEAEKKQRETELKKLAEAKARAEEEKRDEQRRETVRKSEEARVLAQAGSGGSPAGSPGGSAGAAGRGDPGYVGQLIALIRPRIVFAVPEGTSPNVHAEFQVDLLPTGEIMALRKLKASGLPGYDEAVERAIRRTDPFPRKRDGSVERTVIIRFRPVDAQ
jgi:colicin import membrane protein